MSRIGIYCPGMILGEYQRYADGLRARLEQAGMEVVMGGGCLCEVDADQVDFAVIHPHRGGQDCCWPAIRQKVAGSPEMRAYLIAFNPGRQEAFCEGESGRPPNLVFIDREKFTEFFGDPAGYIGKDAQAHALTPETTATLRKH